MRSASPFTSTGVASTSQHANGKVARGAGCAALSQPSLQQQQERGNGSVAKGRPMSAAPLGLKSSSEGGHHGGEAGGGRNGGGRQRPASAVASLRHGSSHEVTYLQRQLNNALQQQNLFEEHRQRRTMEYRRQLRAFCDENATLRNIIQAGERRKRDAEATAETAESPSGAEVRAHGSGSGEGPATVTEAELEVLAHRINLARQRHNQALHNIRVCKTALLEESRTLKTTGGGEENAALSSTASAMGANRSVYLRIMRLEQLLNELLRKQGTVSVVLTNYHYHLEILSSEAAQYDAHQVLIDKEYADRHRDHLQLLQLHAVTSAAYTDAVNMRQAMQQRAGRMRNAKERALHQKRREVEEKLEQTQQQERRTVDVQQQLEEETQLLEAAENTKDQLELHRANARTATTLLKSGNFSRDPAPRGAAIERGRGMAGLGSPSGVDERAAAYEVAIHEMLRIAKVTSLDALVAAYQAEVERQGRLEAELEQVREVHATLQHEVQQLREHAKQTRYCVGAGVRAIPALPLDEGAAVAINAAASPMMERELQTFVKEEKEALANHVTTNESNQSLLREVAERVNRIADLVADYRADVRLPKIEATAALAKRSSTLPLHTAVLTQKLLCLAADATRVASTGSTSLATSSSSAANHARSAVVPVMSSAQLTIPANNCRVSLRHNKGSAARGRAGNRGLDAADVAAISSTAARALLHSRRASAFGPNSEEGAPSLAAMHRRRRSSATLGAGFIEGQEDEDEILLATVAALPPPGGRVFDFDDDISSDTSGQTPSAADHAGETNTGTRHAGVGAGASSAAAGRVQPGSFVKSNRNTSEAAQARVRAITGVAAGDDQEDPLCRVEVKHMSEMLVARQKREKEEELKARRA